jgi:23S rRNA pseudouridine1911/1915/1917 synthase
LPGSSGVKTTYREMCVTGREVGARLDNLLSSMPGNLSRAGARLLVESASVLVNGRRETYPSYRVRADDVILMPGRELLRLFFPHVSIPAHNPPRAIIFSDTEIIVAEKPPGVLSVSEGKPSAQAMDALLARESGARVFPVHRLDRDTSGLILFARTSRARDALEEQFRSREVVKAYLALVEGTPTKVSGRMDSAVSPRMKDKRSVSGKPLPAVTNYRVIGTHGPASLLELDLETGRTHQVRIHMRRLGHPVIGERVYCNPAKPPLAPFQRHCLHARGLGFTHPASGEKVEFSSPLPPDISALAAGLDRLASEGFF